MRRVEKVDARKSDATPIKGSSREKRAWSQTSCRACDFKMRGVELEHKVTN